MNFLQKTKNNYIYDKRIFWGAFIIVCLICFSIFWKFGFDIERKLYFNCKSPVCQNIIIDSPKLLKYCNDDWCKQETLNFGEYGTPPLKHWSIDYFWIIACLIMFLTIPINHFIHNRGKKFEILTEHIPKCVKESFKKIPEMEDITDDNKDD